MNLDVENVTAVLNRDRLWLNRQMQTAPAYRREAVRMYKRCIKERKAQNLRMAKLDRSPGCLPSELPN
jgi:hypothetical protein